MSWYSIGQLSVTQGSQVVTGTGTQFETFVYPGFGIFINQMAYEVASADSATQITLTQPYLGATNAAVNYSIWPTQALNYEVWQNTTALVETFGPLRNNLTLLNQQISDTAGYRDTASAQALAAAQSATDSANSAMASKNSATNSSTTAANSAASATASEASRQAAKVSETNSAASASDANNSKLAASSSAADALTNKNATTTLRSDAQTARDAAVAAQTASQTARDAAITAQGAAEGAEATVNQSKTDAQIAATASAAARDAANDSKNAAASSATNASTSETNAAADASAAQTAANNAASARDAAKAAQTASEGARDTTVSYRDAAAQSAEDAANSNTAAQAAAARAEEPINMGAIEDALGGTPALLEGATFTGAVSVPPSFTITPQNTDVEGGQFSLQRAPNQGLTGDLIIDTEGNNFRAYDNGKTTQMLNVDLVNGAITINSNTVYHTANLTKGTLGVGNVDNTSDVNKPVSTAQQTALIAKANLSGAAFTGGVSGTTLSLSSTASVTGALSVSGQSNLQKVYAQDIIAARSSNTGVLYLGSDLGRYLYFDGANLQIAGMNTVAQGTLQVNGGTQFNSFINTSTNSQVNFGATTNVLNGQSYQWFTGTAGTDNKYWRINNGQNGNLNLETVNDAYSAASPALIFTRSGQAPSHAYLYPDLTVYGIGVIGQFQAVAGSGSTWYNTGWRNDGSTLYLMQSAAQTTQAGAATSGWNNNRPFALDLASGNLTLGAPTTAITGTTNVNGVLNANSYLNVAAQANFAAPIYANANNGGRQAIRCGDDAWLGDANIGHTISVTSTSDANQGFLVFGQSSSRLGMTGNDNYLRFDGEIASGSWLRNTNPGAGWYSDPNGQGLCNVGGGNRGATYRNVITWGTGRNGWNGYSVGGNDMFLMSNMSNMRGLYSPSYGGWLVSWDNSGNATFAQNITAFSDERIKENIRPIDNVWERYKGLKGITYEREGKTRLGVGRTDNAKGLSRGCL